MIKRYIKLLIISATLTISTILGVASAATTVTPKVLMGVPISTFCSAYAKNLAYKSVAISIVLKIRDNPEQKAALLRTYGSFISLGAIYCKGSYAPSVYGFNTTTSSTPVNTNTDISQNTPIINTNTGIYTKLEDYFTGYDTSALANLNSQQLDIIQQRIVKAKNVYGDIVDNLIHDGRLDLADRNEMVGKITFKFSNNCNELDGKILVRQWYDQNNNPLKSELVNLFVTINLCFNDSYDNNYDEFLHEIITHELGHYYDYFQDTNDSNFRAICRAGDKNLCISTDFVDSYAASSADEDYAETFAYYIQRKQVPVGTKMQQKIDYFKIKDPRY